MRIEKSIALEHQPQWAQQQLKRVNTDPDEVEGSQPARPAITICSGMQLLELVGQGGLVVTDELLSAYPEVSFDIKHFIKQGKLRHIRPDEDVPRRGSSQQTKTAAESLRGIVLFPRLEDEVEAIKVDEDLRAAYHSTPRPAVAESNMSLQRPEAPKKRARRTRLSKPPSMQNSHMM
mmetsp:Transcript_40557/g.91043  ORF Transcript_40557/g.91043 Transcript_40557/m.91043 type:complete len:177 (+) Transcript_40557:32-562(+)